MTASDMHSNSSSNCSRPAMPSTPERRSVTPNRQNRQNASIPVVKTPKMETPLWIKLRAELLMAPKKTVIMLRRHSTTPSYEAGGAPNETAGDGNRRPRALCCKDLFGAKESLAQARG